VSWDGSGKKMNYLLIIIIITAIIGLIALVGLIIIERAGRK
jgi:hypothetical protein